MSDLFINWRFGGLFVQLGRSRVRFSRAPGRPRGGEPWVEFYQGRRYAVLLAVLLAVAVYVAL